MKRNLFSNSAVLLLFTLFLYQCTDPHERYELPPWLGGTNIETLEERGNYTQFLALMDRAEYRVSIENQLFTLFAPNDSAFTAFFADMGISSVEDLSIEQAEELFTQHILVNPRSRNQLLFEYAWGELQDERGEYGTLFHRKETYSVPIDYFDEVLYNEEFKEQTLQIRRSTTCVPLFTTEYFEDYFGDPEGSDYLFLYPGSSWSGTQWHDAMVTESEVRTSSGFIYFVDRVVKPMPTIDLYLKNEEKFSIYYDLAQRFATYVTPQLNEKQERTYRKSYSTLLDLAQEKGPDSGYPSYMLYMFSAFIPSDDVLQEYLDNTVYQYYDNIDSAPQLFLTYLLQSHLMNRLILPSKMRDRFLNYYGDRIDVDVDTDIETVYMASNGAVFHMNRVLEPNAFTCVPGPIFYNGNYSTLLYALQITERLNTLISPSVTVTLVAPTNDEVLAYGIRQRKNEDGTVFLQIQASDGTWHTIESEDLEDFAEDHIYIGSIEDFSGEGFLRMASDNYLYYNNGEIYGGGNQFNNDPAEVSEKLASDKNGNLFYLNNSIQRPLNAAEYILNDPDLSDFVVLLDSAGIIDSTQADYELVGVMEPRMTLLNALQQWTIFAPTNQALADARAAGQVPDFAANDGKDLEDFIHYHFVRGKAIFDDGKFNGEVQTQKDTIIATEQVFLTLDISNSTHNLSVQDLSGNTVNVDHADANKLIEHGVIHKINTVLMAKP